MKGDFTRFTFAPRKNYSAVLLQQGRVLLDADWNEQRAIDLAAERQLTRDLIGPTGGPIGATGYAIDWDGTEFTVAPGRYYVNGICCELKSPQAIRLSTQPDLPAPAPEVDVGHRYLVYLDVWERHITHIEDPEIKEKALGGPDHTTRAQVVAQVRLLELDLVESDGECDTFHSPTKLATLIEGRRGRLAASVDPTPPTLDPCVVPASAGYRGLENQLYRVEIHKGAADDSVTFKWSRDNGSVATAWTGQPDPLGEPQLIEVADLGPDSERSFNEPNLLVEVLDDGVELRLEPGLLARVDHGDEGARTLRLKDGMDEDGNPDASVLNALSFATSGRHPRVRRWDNTSLRRIDAVDQNDGIYDWINLEQGVRIRFLAGASRSYRTGDYWLIPARTVDGSIHWAPNDLQSPHGPKHHYAALAIARPDSSGGWIVDDLQEHFPSATEQISLNYVGGDGQQAFLADPTSPFLSTELEVQARNGGLPLTGATVQFSLVGASDGTLKDSTSAASGPLLNVLTDSNGRAAVHWQPSSQTARFNDSALVNQAVLAMLLDECEDPTTQIIRFSCHESQAAEVRLALPSIPQLEIINAAGFETDQVQGAIEVLTANPHLSYVSGDGQEAMPGEQLPAELVVRVGNGAWPMAGVVVVFTLVDLTFPDTDLTAAADEAWAGQLQGSMGGTAVDWTFGNPRQIRVTTDGAGQAHVRWVLGSPAVTVKRPGVRAQIELPGAPIPFSAFSPGAQVLFVGRWSVASQVAYDPACAHLEAEGVSTVQQALDALCGDRTLYYVSGTGQKAELGQPLAAPLVVRVANEGQPIEGATVRLELIDLANTTTLAEITAGYLDPTGGASILLWSAGHARQVDLQSDAQGLVSIVWTWPTTDSAVVPGVRATLLDAGGNPTTSVVQFGGVRAQSPEADAEGIQIKRTSMLDRYGVERTLWNDSTVDPYHLLSGIQIHCSGQPDAVTLTRKRTVHLRIQVPYGWPLDAKVSGSFGKDDDYFEPKGVQHYDEYVVASTVDVKTDTILWQPTTAARRMLVSTGPGPFHSSGQPQYVPTLDLPLPLRLRIFGGGERMVRAMLTVEGDFITATGNSNIHLDGESLGAPNHTGRIDLRFGSGDGRAGGDFRSWFWLDLRTWRIRDVTNQLVSADYSMVAAKVAWSAGTDRTFSTDVSVASVSPMKGVSIASYDSKTGNWSSTQPSHAVNNAVSQRPAMWRRTTGGADDGFTVGWFDTGKAPTLMRVQGDGTATSSPLRRHLPGAPAAASPPAGAAVRDKQVVVWATADGGLHAAIEGSSSAGWSEVNLSALVFPSAARALAPILPERDPVNSRAASVEPVIEELGGPTPRAISIPGLEHRLGEGRVEGLFHFYGPPVVLVDSTPSSRLGHRIQIFAEASNGAQTRLYWFSRLRTSGSWIAYALSAAPEMQGWRPAMNHGLTGDVGLDEDGETVQLLAWLADQDTLLIAERRGKGNWTLSIQSLPDKVVEGSLPSAIVDGFGVRHVHVATRTAAGPRLIAYRADPRTPWTETDLTARLKLPKFDDGPQLLRSPDGTAVVSALGAKRTEGLDLVTTWLELPREGDLMLSSAP